MEKEERYLDKIEKRYMHKQKWFPISSVLDYSHKDNHSGIILEKILDSSKKIKMYGGFPEHFGKTKQETLENFFKRKGSMEIILVQGFESEDSLTKELISHYPNQIIYTDPIQKIEKNSKNHKFFPFFLFSNKNSVMLEILNLEGNEIDMSMAYFNNKGLRKKMNKKFNQIWEIAKE